MAIWDTFKKTSGLGMLQSFLDPSAGYEDATKELQRGWGNAQQYMQPYNTAGQGEIGHLQGAQGALMNPAQLENEWASGYETSPYAKEEIARSQGMGLDAASSMGLQGSSAALENIQRTGSSIGNADRRNYLQDLMQKYLAGVGVSQNLFGTGAGMGTALGQGRMDLAGNLAQTRYGEASAPGEMFGRLLGMGVGFASGGAGGWQGGAGGASGANAARGVSYAS